LTSPVSHPAADARGGHPSALAILLSPSTRERVPGWIGAGAGKWLTIHSPFVWVAYGRDIRRAWTDWASLYHDKAGYGIEIPYPIFPESGGLLPFGSLADVDILNWLAVGDPGRWPLVYSAQGEGFIEVKGYRPRSSCWRQSHSGPRSWYEPAPRPCSLHHASSSRSPDERSERRPKGQESNQRQTGRPRRSRKNMNLRSVVDLSACTGGTGVNLDRSEQDAAVDRAGYSCSYGYARSR
jgi:hypothetical protein